MTSTRKIMRCLGVIVQGVVLGTLLSVALWKIAMLTEGARIFRYQGF